jgi:hypothetical protein
MGRPACSAPISSIVATTSTCCRSCSQAPRSAMSPSPTRAATTSLPRWARWPHPQRGALPGPAGLRPDRADGCRGRCLRPPPDRLVGAPRDRDAAGRARCRRCRCSASVSGRRRSRWPSAATSSPLPATRSGGTRTTCSTRRWRQGRGSRGTAIAACCRPTPPSWPARPTATQLFRCGRAAGVQFHPEVTHELVAGWVVEVPARVLRRARHVGLGVVGGVRRAWRAGRRSRRAASVRLVPRRCRPLTAPLGHGRPDSLPHLDILGHDVYERGVPHAAYDEFRAARTRWLG